MANYDGNNSVKILNGSGPEGVTGAKDGSGKVFMHTAGPGANLTEGTEYFSLSNPAHTRNTDALPLISSAQDLTGSFADLGGELSTQGYKYLYLYLVVDINSSADVRIKALGKTEVGGSNEYDLDHRTFNAPDTSVSGTDDYLEIDTDADQLLVVEIPLTNSLPYVQIQVSAGTVGATAGQIDEAHFSLGY